MAVTLFVFMKFLHGSGPQRLHIEQGRDANFDLETSVSSDPVTYLMTFVADPAPPNDVRIYGATVALPPS